MTNFYFDSILHFINFFVRKNKISEYDNSELNMRILHLMQISNKYHLMKYGRMIIGCNNDKRKLIGNAPANILFGIVSFFDKSQLSAINEMFHGFATDVLSSRKEFDQLYFSKSDIEAMEVTHNRYGDSEIDELSDILHCNLFGYPETSSIFDDINNTLVQLNKEMYNNIL